MKRSLNKGRKTLEKIKAEHEIIARLAKGNVMEPVVEKGVSSRINDLFTYDWIEKTTVENFEKNFGKFKFQGPGWYLTDNETLLVVPMDKSQAFGNKGYYTFYYWSHNLAGEGTNALVNAPTRVDDRS